MSPSSVEIPAAQVGVGYRSKMRAAFVERPTLTHIAFIEVTAESFLRTPASIDDIGILRDQLPLISHSVGLSIGSPWGLDLDYLLALRSVVRRTGAKYHSDHLAITSGPGAEFGHLTPVPLTNQALEVVCANIAFAQEFLGMPLALENISQFVRPIPVDLDELTFFDEIARRTGAKVVLDVTNAWVNDVNFGDGALEILGAIPSEHVAHFHVAGGSRDSDGFYVDTHSSRVPAEVLELLERVGRSGSTAPIILEYDQNVPSLEELDRECGEIHDRLNLPKGD